ncbi:hypothetical protein [Cellulomonas sp. HZM]|uniref:hypothetical protein n=1 Tax=Cellulomonas sp. HZM TaxID=1454010 RepID=UPI0004939824|nr:hypothetical protein [Cellulomonas sp. HZM]
MRRRRTAGLLVVAAGAAAVLVGCSSAPQERPVTQDEAQTLATIRFHDYDAGTRAFSTSVTDASGTLDLAGWVDFRDHTGYALATQDDAAPSLLLWDGSSARLQPAPAGTTTAPLPVPVALRSTAATPLDARSSGVHATLLVLLDLGSDRPENPLLLQQGGARWLRSDDVDGTDVDVFAATKAGTSRYWVAQDGTLVRAEVQVGGRWTTIDLGAASSTSLAKP